MRKTGLKSIYLDYDGVIVNTVETIVSLYNEDFKYYKKFKFVPWYQVYTWNFTECNCASKKYIDTYFNTPRFFHRLQFMEPCTKDIIYKLREVYNVKIVSMGKHANLKLKEEWIEKNLPGIEFVGLDLKKFKDKSSIDMKDGLLLDDNEKMLFNSNAFEKVCFGDKYGWNDGWYGPRLHNWSDVERYLL